MSIELQLLPLHSTDLPLNVSSMEDQKTKSIGVGVAMGVALGAGLGAAFDNVGIGIAIGIAIGAALGSGYAASKSDKGDGNE